MTSLMSAKLNTLKKITEKHSIEMVKIVGKLGEYVFLPIMVDEKETLIASSLPSVILGKGFRFFSHVFVT
jgi:hypothetical protein